MKKMLVLDIDQTLVDSSIRENLSFSRDVLNLEQYKRQKYCENLGIESDSILPLGEMLESVSLPCPFVLVTAREFDEIDYKVLGRLIPNIMLDAKVIINRNNCHLFGSDKQEQASGRYKQPIFEWLKAFYNRNLVIIDDCPKVLQVARESGYKAVCARDLWHLSEVDIMRVLENALY